MIPRLLPALLVTCALLAGCSQRGSPALASAAGDAQQRLAPGFDGATAWLNVDHPLTLAELKGKVVVVDFWTSCCINCIHTLPVLGEIERKYAGRPVVVVGIHSPKFDAETESERLREILGEYSIHHPIAVDGSMKLWNAWGARSWPTLMVLDAAGRIVWTGSGEPTRGTLETVVDGALARGLSEGLLSDRPIAGLRPERETSGPLAFPGKVLARSDGSRVIADSGHNRIVLVGPDGAVRSVVGSGLAGLTDGSYAEASFRKPQGLAAMGDVLYVADTENHAIRAIDLKAQVVRTVAGTGEIGTGPIVGAGPARDIKLRSPWDIVSVGDNLYVALAGSHQIAVFSPKDGTLAAFAGDGQERRVDGVGMAASFAQPSGLATDGSTLFVADSETSSIRAVSIATRQVKTLVGRDLFVFGDVDGPASGVRLEHPLGVAWAGGAVWVVDTYNSKLKRIDPVTGETHTVVGGRDHKALFEPEGLAASGGDLLVADTKHHRIVRVKQRDGSLEPVALSGLTVPSTGVAVAAPAPTTSTDRITLGDVPLLPTGETVVHFGWRAPPGTGVNEEAPFHLDWTSSDGLALVPTPLRTTGATVHDGFDIKVTPIAGGEGGRLEGQLSLVICDVTTHRVCVPVRRAIELTFRTATSKTDARTVMIPLPEAKP